MPLPGKTDLFVVAVLMIGFLVCVVSSTFIVSHIILANSRENEYRVFRQEYRELLDSYSRRNEVEMNRLREQVNRLEFVTDRRYNLLQDEVNMLKNNKNK